VIRPVSQETKEFIVTKTIRFGAIALMLMTTGAGAQAGAQDKPASAPQPKPAASPALLRSHVPLKIQLVLSRYQGEKKLSSVPYLLWITSNDQRSSLRMGVKIPVYAGGGAGNYSYQDVGTNIDCQVSNPTPDDGWYKVLLIIADSSIYFPNPVRPGAGIPPPTNDTTPPAIRSFTSTFTILLRDGQTGQYTSAVDQASGEVLKIDATLNVLK
jgi:hypothetical protein